MKKPQLLHGDCLTVLPTLAADSIDAIVTDPPYELTQAKRTNPPPVGTGPYGRTRMGVNGDNKPVGGFMGKEWDGTGIAHSVEFWREALRVLKPGAHLLAFGGSRTYHRLACAVEDAGFEIRDQIQWLYGSGFPKSHDVSKGIDRAAGAEREVVGEGQFANGSFARDGAVMGQHGVYGAAAGNPLVTAPATDTAIEWQGWGTALKPACEPCVLARKPLSEPTVAANVLKWGTGALNIDGCRVGAEEMPECVRGKSDPRWRTCVEGGLTPAHTGRWPANVIIDGSEEVVGAFPDSDHARGNIGEVIGGGMYGHGLCTNDFGAGDSGSAARFFYHAKANKKDRNGSKHPTVKPVDLIAYLCRLITPPGGVVLDPFAGSGTLASACAREGFSCILIEREAEYVLDIRRRLMTAAQQRKSGAADAAFVPAHASDNHITARKQTRAKRASRSKKAKTRKPETEK